MGTNGTTAKAAAMGWCTRCTSSNNPAPLQHPRLETPFSSPPPSKTNCSQLLWETSFRQPTSACTCTSCSGPGLTLLTERAALAFNINALLTARTLQLLVPCGGECNHYFYSTQYNCCLRVG